jgi:hypothetical protein
MRLILALFMVLTVSLAGFSQQLDLTQEELKYETVLEQKPDVTTPEGYKHDIVINTKQKTILVTRKYDGEIIYNLRYVTAYNGTSASVQLQPGETIFMMASGDITIVAHSASEQTFSFINQENKIHLFGQIYVLEE